MSSSDAPSAVWHSFKAAFQSSVISACYRRVRNCELHISKIILLYITSVVATQANKTVAITIHFILSEIFDFDISPQKPENRTLDFVIFANSFKRLITSNKIQLFYTSTITQPFNWSLQKKKPSEKNLNYCVVVNVRLNCGWFKFNWTNRFHFNSALKLNVMVFNWSERWKNVVTDQEQITEYTRHAIELSFK